MQPTPQNPVNPYLRTKILTASPHELRLMLYEGAIKFCQQAMPALEARDFDTSYHALMRAQKIVLELSTSLKHDIAPDLCDKLNALYNYIYRLLVDANVQHEVGPVQEAIDLLTFEKETWQMLMDRLARGEEAGDTTVNHADVTAAQQTAMNTLSRSA